MAKAASKCLLIFLLSILTVCSSGTEVGFFYDARNYNAIPSRTETLSFLRLQKVIPSQVRVSLADHGILDSSSKNGVSVDLYLNKSVLEDLKNHKPSAASWLKAYLSALFPLVNIKSLIVSSGSFDLADENELPVVLSTLKALRSLVNRFNLGREVKVSISFSLPLLENLKKAHAEDLERLLRFISKGRSFMVVEATIERDLGMGDQFVESVTKAAELAAAAVVSKSYNDVSVVLTIKSSAVPSAREVAEFKDKILASFESGREIKRKVIGLFAEVSSMEEFGQNKLGWGGVRMHHSFHRDLLGNFNYKATQHDSIDPPTIFPTPVTNPVTTPPVTVPADNPVPIIVTVPSTNPASNPLTVPPTTPVQSPYTTNPVNSPVPITNPVTTPSANPGTQPITNPVTMPINPVTPPAAIPGQSWCLAKTGASETALQLALDYACGMGGADCSAIQQGGSCYNPNTLQSHASYAFNSYYQKNPTQTSCDFGGAAVISNGNPSIGSCVFPLSSSPSSTPVTNTPVPATTSPTPTTTSPTPTTTTPMPTISSPVAGVSGSGSLPTVLNASNPDTGGPTTVFGDGPPASNSTSDSSTILRPPLIACIILVASFIAGKLILDF